MNTEGPDIAGRGGSPLQDLVTTISEVFLTVGAGEADLFRKRRQVLQVNPDLALEGVRAYGRGASLNH